MEFKFSNTETRLAESISLVVPDVIEDPHSILFGLVWVCEFLSFRSDPHQCFFIMCQPGLKLRHTGFPVCKASIGMMFLTKGTEKRTVFFSSFFFFLLQKSHFVL